MAIEEFYMQTTGANTNAGSTTADAASVTSTNGDYGNAAANRFTAASGTPFSGVTAGMWASIYTDGSSSTSFIAQVTAVNGGGASIDLSTTVRLGTAPSNSATGRTCKIGGAWASFAIVDSVFAAGTAGATMRVNVKAGTYANTTNDRLFAAAGTTAFPIYWRGYNTTPGDLDTEGSHDSLSLPAITFGDARFITTGNYQFFSNLDISGAQTSNGQVRLSGSQNFLDRCKIACTSANANGRALSVSGAGGVTRSRLTSNAAADVIGVSASFFDIFGCSLAGGKKGIAIITDGNFSIQGNTFRGLAEGAIHSTDSNAATRIVRNSAYDLGAAFFEQTAAPAAFKYHYVIGNLVEDATHVINSSGATTAHIIRIANSYYNVSTPEAGLGDTPALAGQTESASPFTNAAGADLSLLGTSNAAGNGFPGRFEGETYRGYADIGAAQRQVTAAGGGLLLNSGMTGGMRG